MLEYLAIPAWNTPATRVDAWIARLEGSAGPVVLTRDGPSGLWLEVATLRLKGYALIENGYASAINFELHAFDPEPATSALQVVVEALGWELHADDDDDEEDPEDDDDD